MSSSLWGFINNFCVIWLVSTLNPSIYWYDYLRKYSDTKKKILDQIRRFVVPGVVFPDALCVLVITLAETKSDKIRQMGLRITSCSFNRCSRESSFHSIIGSYYLICLTGPQWSRAGREVIIGCFVYVNSLTCT